MSEHAVRPSKSAIDKLGERLKNGDESDEALRMLGEYRALFDPIADELIPRIETIAGPVNRRVGKTTMAIVAKLRRIYQSSTPIRLSQIQDIAGARIVVGTIVQQNILLAALREGFPNAKFADKRHDTGTYRAVHVIIKHENLPFELQIRTKIQHDWAQLSEDFAAQYGSEVKYGHGPDEVKEDLTLFSETGFCEEAEMLDFSEDVGIQGNLILHGAAKQFRTTLEEPEKHTS
jgi:ppGpp synthetase/RelA/SpoT-type nucleotidyltranferase